MLPRSARQSLHAASGMQGRLLTKSLSTFGLSCRLSPHIVSASTEPTANCTCHTSQHHTDGPMRMHGMSCKGPQLNFSLVRVCRVGNGCAAMQSWRTCTCEQLCTFIPCDLVPHLQCCAREGVWICFQHLFIVSACHCIPYTQFDLSATR